MFIQCHHHNIQNMFYWFQFWCVNPAVFFHLDFFCRWFWCTSPKVFTLDSCIFQLFVYFLNRHQLPLKLPASIQLLFYNQDPGILLLFHYSGIETECCCYHAWVTHPPVLKFDSHVSEQMWTDSKAKLVETVFFLCGNNRALSVSVKEETGGR